MKPRSILILYSFLCSFFLHGQTDPNKQLKVNSKFSESKTHNLVNSRISDTCLDKKFSIVFYLINDSMQQLPHTVNAMNSYSLTDIMNILNTAFAPICVSFEHCKTVIIPNWPYNKWMANVIGNQIVNTWYNENTINVYLPWEVVPIFRDSPEHSYAYAPATGTNITRDAIVIEVGYASYLNAQIGFKGAPLLHAFGHYFGLPHTSDEIDPTNMPNPGPVGGVTTFEYADRTNCSAHGDGFCDTDADPWPNLGSGPSGGSDCSSSSAKDGKGRFYTPPFDNIMSHYECRCRFTPQQYRFMARYMVKERKYLH